MASFFPLFKLPFLCVYSVLYRTDVNSLMRISIISRRCHRTVKSLKNNLSGLYVSLGENAITIDLHDIHQVRLGGWLFTTDLEKQIPMSECLTMCCHAEYWLFRAAKYRLKYFKDLFTRPIKRIRIYTDTFDNPQNAVLLGITTCDELYIKGRKEIKNEYLQFILRNIRFTKEIRLDLPVNSDFHCFPDHFQSKYLLASRRSEWLKPRILLDLKCSNILLRYSVLTPDALVAFIDKWFNSEDRTFEYIYLAKQRILGNIDTSRFKMEKWNEKRRGPFFQTIQNTFVDCSSGLDLQRKDGLWATLLVQEDNLFFGVWHELFHDVTGRLVLKL